MLRQGLILTSQREYAQAMRSGLIDKLGNGQSRVDVELDALRAMQLVPQCSGLDWTQAPAQRTKPPVQTQEPAVQVLPLPQTVSQVPQFWLSLCRLTQEVPHCI